MMIFLLIILVLIVILCVLFPKRLDDKYKIIKGTLRQASRWSLAAKQDMNPVIATLHANYGAAYLFSVLESYDHSDVQKALGNDNLSDFRDAILKVQDDATKRLGEACPNLVSSDDLEDNLLKKIAGH